MACSDPYQRAARPSFSSTLLKISISQGVSHRVDSATAGGGASAAVSETWSSRYTPKDGCRTEPATTRLKHDAYSCAMRSWRQVIAINTNSPRDQDPRHPLPVSMPNRFNDQ